MGNRGLVLDGNTGGSPKDNSGDPGAVLRLFLVAARLCLRGRPLGGAGSVTLPCDLRI